MDAPDGDQGALHFDARDLARYLLKVAEVVHVGKPAPIDSARIAGV